MEVIPSSSRLLLWLISSLFALLFVRAYSYATQPLTYLEFVTNPSIEILPRNRLDNFESSIIRRDIEDDTPLRHDDCLRIQFKAFNRTFSIHLEPNLDLFHPEATITIHHSDNSKTTTRLRPEDHRLYKGVLLDIDSTDNRLNEDIVGFERMSLSEELSHSSGVLGWARIQIHDDGGVTQFRKNDRHPIFEGVFSLDNELYNIKSTENFKLTQYKDDPEIPTPSSRQHIHRSATMVIYRDSDIKNTLHDKRSLDERQIGACSMDDIVSVENRRRNNNDQNFGQLTPWWNSLRIGDSDKLRKRQSTEGCPTGRKIAYMGAVADCTYVANYKSPDAARKQILQDWGSASVVYEKTFNVTLGLIKMEILDQNCPTTDAKFPFNRQCDDSYSINDRLSDFSKWRGEFPDDGASLWHLMSKCNTGTKVGVAWLGQLCQSKATFQEQDKAFVSGTGVSTIVKDEWKVVAHEVGHGFGAVHDCITETCPCNNCGCCPLSSTICDAGGQYLMNPTSNVVTDEFSPCSINYICQAFPNIGSCLADPGTKPILSQSMCGNGLKEDNEECDCGSECDDDPCCDGATCKLKGNAVCDDKNDMCCRQCQYKPANEVCRPASSNCDIPEVCNGTSGDCPIDKHIEDGTTCAANLACAGGQCTSRDNQCLMRGKSMGITKACSALSDSSCTISCANPNDANSCIQMSGFFVDGTPCGFGGKCNKGKCDSGSIGNNLSSWLSQNKKIVIPIAVIVGGLLLCCLLQCVYRCCKRRPSRMRVNSLPPDDRYSGSSNFNNYNNHNSYSSGKWVDPSPYNGYNDRPERYNNERPERYNNERPERYNNERPERYNNERSPMPMPTPTHQQQRSRSPDYTYAGTGPIHPLPLQASPQRPNVSPVSQRSPVSPSLARSPNSPHPPSPPGLNNRSHFVDDTLYNGPRTINYQMNNNRQYTPYRRNN